MTNKKISMEDIMITGLSHILKRTLKVGPKDQLAIAQEYKEWINCISSDDLINQEVLFIKESFFE